LFTYASTKVFAMITQELVTRIQELAHIHYGERISREKAEQIATGLVPYLRHQCQSVLKNKYAICTQERNE
jgi:hypothetical protein